MPEAIRWWRLHEPDGSYVGRVAHAVEPFAGGTRTLCRRIYNLPRHLAVQESRKCQPCLARLLTQQIAASHTGNPS